MDRRTFITTLAAVSVTLVSGCDDDSSEPLSNLPPVTDDLNVRRASFPYGVQAGAMTASEVNLWGFTTETGMVRLLVWPDASDPVEAIADRLLDPTEGYIKVRMTELEPGITYGYALISETDVWSEWGRFRTAFSEDTVAPVLVGATACTSNRRAPFPSLRYLARQPLDVFCHLGDMSYNDGSTDRESFRQKWSEILTNEDYRELLTSVGVYQTWDDHEITNNSRLETLDADILETGKAAYFEATPVDVFDTDRIWTSYRWGRSVEFFILDCRQERRPEDGQYISPEQMGWLKTALTESPCHFKVLLNSVPIAQLPPIFLSEEDRWQGYPEQRQDLLDYITQTPVENVWFLAGDFHMGAIWRVDREGPEQELWEILCGPGGCAPSRRIALAESGEGAFNVFFHPDQVVHVSGKWAATTLLFDPETDTVTVRFVDSETEDLMHESVLSSRRAAGSS